MAAKTWRDLPKTKKARYLLDHPQITDVAWTDEKRIDGESRDQFIKRQLGRAAALIIPAS